MQEAITSRRKGMLRLVKSSDSILSEQKNMIDTDDYYKQVERYAEQIRKTNSADEIIRILDIVLSETRGLRFSDEVFAAQEQVKRAELKIEALKGEIEQLRGLVHTDQMTGAFNRRGLDEIFKREAALTIIHRLQNNLTKNTLLNVDNQLTSITFSAGVALRSFGEHQHSVISRADQALYQAKRTGKNRAIPALL